jgi:hypothetical protein
MAGALLAAGFCCGGASALQLLQGIYEPGLAKDSAYYREIVASPWPASTREQTIIWNILAADFEDTSDGNALLHYIEAQGFAKLLGKPGAPAHTVGEAIALSPTLKDVYDTNAIMQDSVHASLVLDDAFRPSVNIENARPVKMRLVEGKLLLQPALPNVYITCKQTGAPPMLDPGATQALPCYVVKYPSVKESELREALQAAAADTSRWSFPVTMLEVDDPPLLFRSEPTSSGWMDRDGASREARSRLESQSCVRRGACLRDLRMRFLVVDPIVYCAAFLFVLAFLAGAAVGRFAKDWRRVMKRTVLVLCALLVLATITMGLLGGAYAAIAVIVTAIAGAVFVVAIVIAMAAGLFVQRAITNRRGRVRA